MRTDAGQPADTRMMNIVHQALRRDLARATTALEADPPPGDRQRQAIAGHLRWMMAFVRAHHASEDDGLYPAVRVRRPDVGAVLDQMDEQHHEIALAVDRMDGAASEYTASGERSARGRLAAAVAALEDVLLPHLRREEDEVMPVVSEALTEEEWMAIEREHNLKSKGLTQLAKEGHWLIDDATPDDRAKVLGLVPAVPRFVLLHGFGRSYRRGRDACWGNSRPPRRVQKHGHTEVLVAADPDAVWAVVVDPTRVGEWSHECIECSYVGTATHAAPGVRFRGRNRNGFFRWGRMCEVLGVEGRELIWRTVPTRLYPDSTVWRMRVTPAEGGTRLEQSFDVVRAPKVLDVLYASVLPAHRDRAAGLTDDLRRLGELARTPAADRSVHPV